MQRNPYSRPRRTRAESRALGKAQTREALIAAAVELFNREGLDGASLDAICARAGYTRGAFYVHFQSRDDLIVAAMEATRARLLDRLIATGHPPHNLEETVRRFADAVARGRHPPASAVKLHQFLDACARSPRIRERHVALLGEAQSRLTAAVRQAQDGGRMRRRVVRDRDVAALILAAALGVELMVEVGYPADVRAGAAALLRLLAP
jgi:AcrR family transcriptional regulator